MKEEITMAAFWTSFLDGLTGEGIFGDLRLPDAPTRMFKPEAVMAPVIHLDKALLVLLPVDGKVVRADEVARLRGLVQDAINETVEGKVKVAMPDVATERYAAG
jgi:hypothetical protein